METLSYKITIKTIIKKTITMSNYRRLTIEQKQVLYTDKDLDIDGILDIFKYAGELNSIKEIISKAQPFGLEVNVMHSALELMQDNPSMTINTAIMDALKLWI